MPSASSDKTGETDLPGGESADQRPFIPQNRTRVGWTLGAEPASASLGGSVRAA